MADTHERLSKAKKLFPKDDSSNLIQEINRREAYSLRKREMASIPPSTWIDNDESEDYDPNGEKPSRKRKFQTMLDDTLHPKKRVLVDTEPKDPTGILNSALLSSLSIYQDDESIHDGEESDYMETEATTTLGPPSVDQHGQGIVLNAVNNDNHCKSIESQGHVNVARGLTTGSPDEQMEDKSADHELIVEPSDHHQSKDVDNSSTSITPEDVHMEDKAAERQPKPETIPPEIQKAGNNNEGQDIEMSVEESQPKQKHASQPLPAGNESPADPFSASLGAGAAQEKPHKSTTHTISTPFAHPVNFGYAPPKDGTNPCHWCNSFAYGIVGLGMKQVKVETMEDGRYMELGEGHVRNGHEPSRMCSNCVQERVRIMKCPGHQTIPLEFLNPELFSFQAAYDSLAPIPGQRPPHKAKNPWCSLCPSPAFFQCGAKSHEARGCGLLLCEACHIVLQALGGNIAEVIMRNNQRDGEEYGSRADAVFLLPGSGLLQSTLVYQKQMAG